jgi:Secretion system C-terminal sorting domain
MKTFLLAAIMIATGIVTYAQNPTIVTPANNCVTFRNFNTTDEDFSSPSIYSDANDVSFFWDAAAGAEIERSGLVVRTASLISPAYIQTPGGYITVGFYYEMPAGTEYRLRIISGTTSPPLEIIATTANGPVWTPLTGTSGNVCILLTDADLTLGRPVRLEFTFRAILPGNMLFDNLAATVAGGPLPVSFEGFVARRNTDGTLKLLWDVGTEENVKGYYVETSTDGLNFTNLGYVTATGADIYSMDHSGKLVQNTFFRVRSIDFDGRQKYTPIIRVNANESLGGQILAYPVPARDQVTVQHDAAQPNTIISLLSPDGKILQSKVVVPGSFQTQFDINRLNAGIYIVRYADGKGDFQTLKVVKN